MKKRLRSAISILLTLVLILQVFPISIFATEEENAISEDGISNDDLTLTDMGGVAYREETQSAEILFEEESLREENVKQFRMDDGSYVAVQYDTPVHYKDENGQWQDIDNTLRLEGIGTAQTYVRTD